MTRDLILSIDNGTQSVRALIFDLKGNLLYKKRVPMQPYVSREPGWAEQDVGYYWTSLCQACQMLWHETPVSKEAIAGVTLTTQRATMINLDK
ncbi:MAG TPA: FGGY family carbohydrate kinase, partial [Smithellaceae bacterium]|nr:FGGY family carbohydrate kinase [Smithellaceae bacterium]HRY38213.1 FGGY family carbohydrate kinase [Smithellaceae bacterium]